MTSTYAINNLNKIANMAKQAKWMHNDHNNEAALQLIKMMQTKLKFTEQEIRNRSEVSA